MSDDKPGLWRVDRILSINDDEFEQYAIAVDRLLHFWGELLLADDEMLVLYERGYSVEGAAALIVTSRRLCGQ